MSNFGSVSAAPNRSLIEAKILTLNRSRDFPDKWILKMDVLKSTALSGSWVIKDRENIEGFVFESTPVFNPQMMIVGSEITAEVEFLGDPRGGIFQIHRIKTRS
jgi:hypothetical protein